MNILVVEDDDCSRQSLVSFLRTLGHHTMEACDGQEALGIYKTGEFHLVLTDIKMPKMDGIDLLRTITSIKDNASVILITGHGDMQSSIEALRAGAYDYLLKPVNIKELAAVIDRVAERLELRRENKVLTERFDEAVTAAAKETRSELIKIKKAYAKLAGISDIIAFSGKMKNIFRQAEVFHADRSIPVFIQGETGTGKEVVAKFIHYGKSGVDAPFVDINCAAIAPNIFESELFGYEAGAFTGGLAGGQKGKFDLAQGGTIFFDEITELPVGFQSKLLRVIQEKELYRVGGLEKIKTNVRIICATNEDIEKRVKEGSFRQDLYYRLNVGRLNLPPLRERKEEILPYANMFLKKYAREKGKKFKKISAAAAELLFAQDWPGNVRELKNTIEWVTLMHNDVELKPRHLGFLSKVSIDEENVNNREPNFPLSEDMDIILPQNSFNLKRFDEKIMLNALEMNSFNKAKTARYLGITRRSLYRFLERLNGEQ